MQPRYALAPFSLSLCNAGPDRRSCYKSANASRDLECAIEREIIYPTWPRNRKHHLMRVVTSYKRATIGAIEMDLWWRQTRARKALICARRRDYGGIWHHLQIKDIILLGAQSLKLDHPFLNFKYTQVITWHTCYTICPGPEWGVLFWNANQVKCGDRIQRGRRKAKLRQRDYIYLTTPRKSNSMESYEEVRCSCYIIALQ